MITNTEIVELFLYRAETVHNNKLPNCSGKHFNLGLGINVIFFLHFISGINKEKMYVIIFSSLYVHDSDRKHVDQ